MQKPTVSRTMDPQKHAPSELSVLFAESASNDDVLTLATTVDTGFEWEAVDECREKLTKDVKIVRERGKIYFNATIDQFPKVQEMRSIDNIFMVAHVQILKFPATDKEADLNLIKGIVHNEMQLKKYLDAWKQLTGFEGKLYPSEEEYSLAAKEHKQEEKSVEAPARGRKRGLDPNNTKEYEILKYRVTCERTGKHLFESADVARTIGGELQDKYHWIVDLTMYHLEIFCKLVQDELITQLRVTHESKHRRNITSFGPTTLRATVCYNLLRLAHPQPGQIIMDPMCGGGSIPIEAALAFPLCYVLCGDNHPKAIARSKSNIDLSITDGKIDLIEWNAFKVPLPDAYIDMIVSDMPFGKRSGRMADNRILYKQCLIEFGRLLKLSTGRMVLLTYDRRSFSQALQAAGNLFRITKTLGVNIGGLQAVVYVLKRSDLLYEKFLPLGPCQR